MKETVQGGIKGWFRMGAVRVFVLSLGFVCAGRSSPAADVPVTLFHLPFDGDCLSIVQPEANPADVKTFCASGGSVTYPQTDLAGVNVVDRLPVRENNSCLMLKKSVVFVDLTAFGLDDDVTEATIEFYIKGETGAFSDWAQIMTIGVANDTAPSLDKNFAAPFIFLAQAKGSAAVRGLHLRCDNMGSTNDRIDRNVAGAVFDGRWHHVVLTVSMDKAGSHFRGWLDGGALSGSKDLSGDVWHGCTPAAGERLWLRIGNPGCTFAVDEFRVTRGVLPEEAFLVLTDAPAPADKETLLYLPFDGDTSTLAHAEAPPSIVAGTPRFSTDVWNVRVAEAGDSARTVRERNEGCLAVNGTVSFKLPYWALKRPALASATIEFFVKGLAYANEALMKWDSPVRITKGDTPFPFILQMDGSCGYFLRADGYEPIPGQETTDSFEQYWATPSPTCPFYDGKWHHVAMTAAARADGATDLTFYFDYVKIKSSTTKKLAWRGLDDGMKLEFGKYTDFPFRVDEFRVTKGVLAPSEFLKAAGALATLLVIR